MRPFDSIVLIEDLRDDLPAGTTGAIVETFPNAPTVFLVECFDHKNKTIDVVEVHAHQMTVTLADFFDDERVALLMPVANLPRGQVGKIVKRVGVGIYAVDFVDAQGKRQQHHVHATHLLLLHEPTQETQQTA